MLSVACRHDIFDSVTEGDAVQLYVLTKRPTFMVVSNTSESSAQPLSARLSKNISTRRKVLGLTQAQLAERLGVDTETLSRFERGKHLPSLLTLERLAELLLTTMADLLAEECPQADDEVSMLSAWLAPLQVEDRDFAKGVLKQCCDHLSAHRAPAQRLEPVQVLTISAVVKALTCPVAELEENIDNIVAFLAAGLQVKITNEKKSVSISADKAYVLYRMVPSVRKQVLAQFPDQEAFWDLQPTPTHYWTDMPKISGAGVVKKVSTKEANEKRLKKVRAQMDKAVATELRATVEHVPDNDLEADE